MKKRMSLLTLLICTMGAMAQDWTNPHGDTGYGGWTTVFADLTVTGGLNVYEGNYELGAWVGDECRWRSLDNGDVVKTSISNANEKFLEIKVPGNYGTGNDFTADNGKAITFKLRLRNNPGVYYDVTATYSGGDIVYGENGRLGEPSGPRVQLSVVIPTITLGTFEVEAGKTFDLSSLISLSPANANMPQGWHWVLGANDTGYASISGDVLTAGTTTRDIVHLSIYDYTGQEELATTTFKIVKHAEAISITKPSLTVNINDAETLSSFMLGYQQTHPYSVTPNDVTDKVQWEIEDASYISYTENDVYSYKPIKGGEVRIRPYIMVGNTKIVPLKDTAEDWITVTINVPVQSISFDWPATNPATTFKCYVGDEIFQRLAGLVKINPTNATNTTITFSDPDANATQYLTFNNTAQSLLAKAAGKTFVQANVDGKTATIAVEIFAAPSKTISAKVNPLIISSKVSLDNANQQIANNLTLGEGAPNLGIVASGDFTGLGGFNNGAVYFGIDANLLPTGQATVTATLSWNDYSNYNGTDATITQETAQASFVVKIVQSLTGFAITITPNTGNPTTGIITLKPQPEDAEFSMNDYSTSVTANMWGDWNFVTLTPDANDQTKIAYSSALPGQCTFTITDGQANGITSTQNFEVPAKVQLTSGWQWKSNPYGEVGATTEAKSLFFGKGFNEARTFGDLLYNDANWGLYGSLNTKVLEQSQMYKVKMNGGQSSYITGGHPTENSTLELHPGWNWIGSPYVYDRKIENFLLKPVIGTVIISKNDGSAEYGENGWQGDLKIIKKGEGYLIYNSTSSVIDPTIKIEAFGSMTQGDETVAGARNRAALASIWQYDHTQFASNMTMVVSMPDLQDIDDYTIGAFVNGECRGEGMFEDGLGFITVHTDGGEQVTFRLYNKVTGQYFNIDQTVKSQTRIGSLSNPMMMTSHESTTGISVAHQENAGTTESYDLSGRKVNGSSKGVSLKRLADGTFCKVMK